MGETIVLVFILCLLGHFVADFTLQGCLANMKQKLWWKKELDKLDQEHGDKWLYNRSDYKHDYIAALIIHGLYWSIITFLPLLFLGVSAYWFALIIILNAAMHASIDNEKANQFCYNLIWDQLLHLVQIIATLVVASIWYWR